MLRGIIFVILSLSVHYLSATETTDCDEGWQNLNVTTLNESAICVKIIDEKTFLEASDLCRNEGGDLATILSDEQQKAIHVILKKKKKKHWIGLTDHNSETSYIWVSGHPSVPAVYWQKGEPNNKNGYQDCVAIDPSQPYGSSWSDELCSEKLPSVCTIAKFPGAPKGIDLETKEGNCPKDFFRIGNRCLKVFTEKPHKNFRDARDACRKFGANGDLASIYTAEEQNILTALMLNKSVDVWIGLHLKLSSHEHAWVRGLHDVSFTNWKSREPNGGLSEKCVMMYRRSSSPGEWNDKNCNTPLGYVCGSDLIQLETPTRQRRSHEPNAPPIPKNPAPKTPKPKPKPTPTAKPKPTGPKCPSGFSDLYDNNNCYMVVSKTLTWHEAEKFCNSHSKSNLVSIHSVSENQMITKLIKNAKVKGELWIGLSDLYGSVENQFNYWSDNTSLTITFLNTKKSYFGNQDCAVTSSKGTWNTRQCTTKAGFICKWQFKKTEMPAHPKETPPGVDCEEGFISFRKSCYKLVMTPENFTDAEKKCKNMFLSPYRKQVHLARVSTVADNYFLMSLLAPIKSSAAWIGLHYLNGTFHWTDNWPVQFTRWPVNMSYTNENTTCVSIGGSTMTRMTGFWRARNCHERLPYICQAPRTTTGAQLQKLKCHSSYSLYNDGKTCYRRLSESMTFAAGKKVCEDDQKKLSLTVKPTLLTLNSIFEMSFIKAWMISSGAPIDRTFWLGLKLKKDQPAWKWINGEPVVFTHTSGFPEDVAGCYYMYMQQKIMKNGLSNVYGMHPDPDCGTKSGGKRTTICKYSLEPGLAPPKSNECLVSKTGLGYRGTRAVTKSGKACVRWDIVNDIRLLVGHRIGSEDSNFCRNPSGTPYQRDTPYCYTTRHYSGDSPPWEYCDIPLCASVLPHGGSHNYVVAVAILIIVLLVTISFFVGVMLWRRTNTARGFKPYLCQHDPEGGTSFYNPRTSKYRRTVQRASTE